MIDFARHRLAPPNAAGKRPPMPPRTWDYFDHASVPEEYRHFYESTIVFATCPNDHTCILVSTVHRVGADGTLSPSYVCPVGGCSFHDYVRLVGWGEP